jgi:hypothetical protein
MGILDFAAAKPAATTTSRNTNNSDRPKAKLWLNIGYELNGKFVNLPIGMPVDTMEHAEVRGQNQDWIKFQTARNALLDALKALGADLEPGGVTEIPNLVIQLRRTSEEMAVVVPENNEYAVDFKAMFGSAAVKSVA